jgi:hypothetical protein
LLSTCQSKPVTTPAPSPTPAAPFTYIDSGQDLGQGDSVAVVVGDRAVGEFNNFVGAITVAVTAALGFAPQLFKTKVRTTKTQNKDVIFFIITSPSRPTV